MAGELKCLQTLGRLVREPLNCTINSLGLRVFAILIDLTFVILKSIPPKEVGVGNLLLLKGQVPHIPRLRLHEPPEFVALAR